MNSVRHSEFRLSYVGSVLERLQTSVLRISIWRERSEDVYDLFECGPRRRFTVMTNAGPLIVHNCGYQVGGTKLQFTAWKDHKIKMTEEEAAWIVSSYRADNPHVVESWWGLQDAACNAIRLNRPTSYKDIWYECVVDAAGRWLSCVLPNGKRIWYFDPALIPYTDKYGRERYEITYQGKDSKRGGAWGTIRTYGGMLFENCIQAIAREVMADAMLRVEAAGYPLILTVHDELISEDDTTHGSDEEFSALVRVVPPWLKGCPIGAGGWSGTRYKKT